MKNKRLITVVLSVSLLLQVVFFETTASKNHCSYGESNAFCLGSSITQLPIDSYSGFVIDKDNSNEVSKQINDNEEEQMKWFEDVMTSDKQGLGLAQDTDISWYDNISPLDSGLHNVVIIDKSKNTLISAYDIEQFQPNKTVRLDTKNASWLFVLGDNSIKSKLLNNLDLSVSVINLEDKKGVSNINVSHDVLSVLSNNNADAVFVDFSANTSLPAKALVEIYLGRNFDVGDYSTYCIYDDDEGSHFVRKDDVKITSNRKIRVRTNYGCDFMLLKKNKAKNIEGKLKNFEK